VRGADRPATERRHVPKANGEAAAATLVGYETCASVHVPQHRDIAELLGTGAAFVSSTMHFSTELPIAITFDSRTRAWLRDLKCDG
jgi:hypothetical protein